jgi:hypothetical protein
MYAILNTDIVDIYVYDTQYIVDICMRFRTPYIQCRYMYTIRKRYTVYKYCSTKLCSPFSS